MRVARPAMLPVPIFEMRGYVPLADAPGEYVRTA